MQPVQRLAVLLFLAPAAWLFSCQGQNNSPAPASTPVSSGVVGGGCEGCEAIYQGMPPATDATDTSAGWNEGGQKLLVTGTVYQRDGQTPAAGVILYYWHTNTAGLYVSAPGQTGEAKRHGYLRGWVKTDAGGRYAVYTIRPGPYPGETMPAHIHFVVKEPAIANPYYMDDVVFDDDPLLTPAERGKLGNRCGSGILTLQQKDGWVAGERNIILGLNIPGYPR